MRLILIADTHGSHEDLVVPDGDVLIHCGDYSAQGTFKDLMLFNKWLGTLPHEHKLVISGNHDMFAEQVDRFTVQEFLSNAIYLENESVYIEGRTFWGSPFTPLFGHWAFMRPRGNGMAKIWSKIPQDLDVLIVHGPPQGILDSNINHELCGCYDLRRAISQRQIRYSIFGHIHEGYGEKTIDETTFINCSVMNEWYDVVNKPVIMDI